MCESSERNNRPEVKVVPLEEAVGMLLEHDITEIRQDEFKGRAFRRGHRVCRMDIERLRDMGKNNLFVLSIAGDEMHEDDAAVALAAALAGEGIAAQGEPREGKVNLIAARDGLLKVNREALLAMNMLGEVVCSTLHENTLVKKGQVVAGARPIPLVIKKDVVDEAARIAKSAGGVIEVREVRKPLAGIVVTGSEVYYGRKKDAFSAVMEAKIEAFGGRITGKYYAPDDESFIRDRIVELINAGADLLIVTGGMSVDPDDVTRFALRQAGVRDMVYGSPVIPGSMALVGYIEGEKTIPVLGVPACGMYHRTTVLDLLLPRILAGERIGRRELAEIGHGGLCLGCRECVYPLCPFGK